MKKRRMTYDNNMARHLWDTTTDLRVAAICSDAIYKQDLKARQEVLRLYAKLMKESTKQDPS